jgi:uncharacterized protein YjbI with pentapeptide repeats
MVNLSGAYLLGTDLRGAQLISADLSEATFLQAKLAGARIDNANLMGAKELTQEQLESALGNDLTRLPAGYSRPNHWE